LYGIGSFTRESEEQRQHRQTGSGSQENENHLYGPPDIGHWPARYASPFLLHPSCPFPISHLIHILVQFFLLSGRTDPNCSPPLHLCYPSSCHCISTICSFISGPIYSSERTFCCLTLTSPRDHDPSLCDLFCLWSLHKCNIAEPQTIFQNLLRPSPLAQPSSLHSLLIRHPIT
jgi:hypothetical protein